MVSTIARKEFLEMVRDGRFRISAGIVFVLLLVSLWMGWKHYSDIDREHRLAQQATRTQWLTQGVKNPHSAAHYGVYAFKPKLPLSLVDQGVDPYTGVAVWLEAHKQDDFKYRPAQDANSLQRFGNLTAAAVLQLLVPLLIVLLTFSTLAGEREQGTLRQVLSLGVRRTDLARGKALGVAAGLGILLVPASIAGAAFLVWSEPVAAYSTVPRIVLLAFSYLLYFVTFAGIALAISARAKSSRAALIYLMAFWIVTSLIAPRSVVDLSRRLDPTPSAFSFAAALDHDLHGGASTERKAAALRAQVLKQYGVDNVDQLPVSFTGINLQKGEDDGALVFDRHYHDLWDQFERQNRVQQKSSLFAPVLAVRSLSMAMAGTDFEQHRHFATAAENYRRFFIRQINDDITRNAVGHPNGYTRGEDLWKKIPEFRYSAPELGEVLRSQVWSIGILTLWCAVSVVFASVSLAGMKPE